MPVKNRKRQSKKPLERTGTISRWGNSLGLRMPKEGVRQLRLRDGESVTMEIGGGRIVIRRASPRKRWTEVELLAGVTPDKIGGEVDWGRPAGREVL
jgi:antitoxin MazE